MKFRLTVALSVCALLFGLIPPAASADAGIFLAAERVEIQGPGASTARLRLPHAAVPRWEIGHSDIVTVLGLWHTFLNDEFAEAAIEGSGAYQGVLLIADGPTPATGESCAGLPKDGCTPVAGLLLQTAPDGTITGTAAPNLGFEHTGRYLPVLPAGDYTVVMLGAPGEPQTVAFGFDGLPPGTTDVATSGTIEGYHNDYLAPRFPDTGAMQGFGSAFDVSEWAFRASGMLVDGGSTTLGRQWGLCTYGGDAWPEQTAFAPGCPSRLTGGGAFEFQWNDLDSPQSVITQATHKGAGTWADGWYFVEHGVAASASAAALTVDLVASRASAGV